MDHGFPKEQVASANAYFDGVNKAILEEENKRLRDQVAALSAGVNARRASRGIFTTKEWSYDEEHGAVGYVPPTDCFDVSLEIGVTKRIERLLFLDHTPEQRKEIIEDAYTWGEHAIMEKMAEILIERGYIKHGVLVR